MSSPCRETALLWRCICQREAARDGFSNRPRKKGLDEMLAVLETKICTVMWITPAKARETCHWNPLSIWATLEQSTQEFVPSAWWVTPPWNKGTGHGDVKNLCCNVVCMWRADQAFPMFTFCLESQGLWDCRWKRSCGQVNWLVAILYLPQRSSAVSNASHC